MRTSTSLLALLGVPLALAAPVTIAIPEGGLNVRQSSDTRNDLTDGSACKAVTVIFARGTTESGNVGSLAGPPFFSALATAIGTDNLAVQGVEYPADIAGFLAGGDAGGSKKMAELVGQAMTQCPDTKVVMSGYSQGGQLVHNAAEQLSADSSAKVSAVVIFGDPDDGDAVGSIPAANVDVICHDGDNICDGGILILAPHLTYSMDAGAAAAFVKGRTGL
ncbi:hypothetical protein V495_03604 [Pseudogymnoascus sp. VKM F-4514 (FW-929)]|nr:hypothetical protein V490_03442 [Pseudogymnoascus sp. VKM F-3557]KFY44157.1 hypothetical protein V495_03604 [Pseudogymnoascus sp. VKM F-4514 (FW-929)]KFY66463.1 hypothetical protein V497_00919 [Pseudogymnoascus sp. VKM F-4516 (FW-969)]